MSDLFEQVQAATQFIQSHWPGRPRVGIVLGTGLGGLAGGRLAGKTVVAMEGRFHFYEGYSLRQITLPVRMMKALGCEVLIVSNAAGGMNPQYAKGDLMVIEDHINLIGDNPRIGKNDDRLGPRFPDMCLPY